ncbi:uncharacterized protein LOC121735437 [Aricia agestis]|uniref:uncharacterized protein LOC121735437 n=1 Tax=Aricia agestis TaxID=91739 RepID=UPI001C208B39|nr:uncharacterized protein LOC121735437 [Aricia agestis]
MRSYCLVVLCFVLVRFGASVKLDFGRISNRTEPRGFFGGGGIFSLGKVLNFFPVGGERECSPAGFNIAKSGICLNPYDCRQREGRPAGDCAHGLGVCCLFEVTCGYVVSHNVTYFLSPGFPELWSAEGNCSIRVDAAHAGITQLRVDFLHFTIGQPNRMTGECDEDRMMLGEGESNITLCGQNHGQHIYYTIPPRNETREEGELPRTHGTTLEVRAVGEVPRLFLMRITQLPLAHAAPHNCLQYYTGDNGTIRTFNYASNGRHLASQEYRACVRRNSGFCSIRYAQCDRRSFRIGSRGPTMMNTIGGLDALEPVSSTPTAVQSDMLPMNVTEAPPQMPVMNDDDDDDEEGSGADPLIIEQRPVSNKTQPSAMSRIWNFILPIWMWGRSGRGGRVLRWSPYLQHLDGGTLQYFGYGTSGASGYGRQRCTDRISIPCENEYFVYGQGLGVCDPYHCGNSFCPGQLYEDCSVQTSITPFAVSVHFGPPTLKNNPEENIGVCLQYRQVPCNE